MSVPDDPGNYFQTTDSIATIERKEAKSKNKHGNPVKLPSKILAIETDPNRGDSVFVAEAAGEIKRVIVEVCKRLLFSTLGSTANRIPRAAR